MIHFTPSQEPPQFDRRVRQVGLVYLQKYPQKKDKFRPYWRRCADELKVSFHSLCAYSVIRVDKGDVDHFVSQSESCILDSKDQIYEWGNYRYADPPVNQTKNAVKSEHILDPFEVQDGWFEMELPS